MLAMLWGRVMPDQPPVITAAAQYRDQLARQDAAALERLARAYAAIVRRLNDKIILLTEEIGATQPTRGEVVRMERYQALMQQANEELARFAVLTQATATTAADDNIATGELNARQLVSTTITGGPVIAGRFNVLPKDAIESILGFLSPDSPLWARIQELAPYTAQLVSDTIVEGVGLGHNPRKIAQEVESAFGQGLTNALRMVRTVQIYSYREASRASYVANGEVVQGWYWGAKLDRGTCISCISQHGKFFPLTERLNDHHNGRCVMIPGVKGFPPPLAMTGEEWFNKQSAADQQYQMGKGMYKAWRAGKVKFGSLTGHYADDIYGEMKRVRPLKELVDE